MLAIAIKFSVKICLLVLYQFQVERIRQSFHSFLEELPNPEERVLEIGSLPSAESSLEDQRLSVIGNLEKSRGSRILNLMIDAALLVSCQHCKHSLATDNRTFAPRSHEESGEKSQVTS